MSELTSAFNAAAAGPSGDSASVSDGPAPSAPGGASASATEATYSGYYAHTSSTPANSNEPMSTQFNALGATEQPITPVAHFSQEHGHAKHVSSAKAELEVLERAKLKPSLCNNLNPDPRIKNTVDLKGERQRLARKASVNAYLKHLYGQPEPGGDYSQYKEIDLAL